MQVFQEAIEALLYKIPADSTVLLITHPEIREHVTEHVLLAIGYRDVLQEVIPTEALPFLSMWQAEIATVRLQGIELSFGGKLHIFRKSIPLIQRDLETAA